MLRIPTLITLARLALIVPLLICMAIPTSSAAWTALALYIVAAISDFLDGWIARFLNQASDFGAMLDQIVDKVFVASVLIMLVASGHVHGIWVFAAVILLGREILISGLREYLGPKGIILPVSKLAKWKTASQMAALGFLIVGPYLAHAQLIGLLLLLTATALSVHTAYTYIKNCWGYLGF
ncbi:MAG: CDP-diacylglycerol--glycerol-3-phosphate 3-phosphatidyltransferase [Alphaproteobacteria bacterium]|nr:CDP-diacylglycerol--glycerol-3-phosphate 3-phosphatidyltransferase [Alphaproteobacteria bacterium]